MRAVIGCCGTGVSCSRSSLPKRPSSESTRTGFGVSADPNGRFFSGSGSHGQEIVAAYVAALEKFLRAFPEKPDVVDLGCGDFAVGYQTRPLCSKYIACDVVEPLIAWNRERFASLDVDFRELDVTTDPLPPGEVAFLRQVLQHLSNRQIQSTIAKIPAVYRYLVLTEHLPASGQFVPNLDKPAGPHTRINAGGRPSGVVLTEPPFNLRASGTSVLCEVRDYLGVIRTTLFEFGSAIEVGDPDACGPTNVTRFRAMEMTATTGRRLRVNIIAWDSGGLATDIDVLTQALVRAGCDISFKGRRHRKPSNRVHSLLMTAGVVMAQRWAALTRRPQFDVNFFIESVFPEHLPTGRVNCLFVHPEWFRDENLTHLPRLDFVLCKTPSGVEAFRDSAGGLPGSRVHEPRQADSRFRASRAYSLSAPVGSECGQGHGGGGRGLVRHPEWPS